MDYVPGAICASLAVDANLEDSALFTLNPLKPRQPLAQQAKRQRLSQQEEGQEEPVEDETKESKQGEEEKELDRTLFVANVPIQSTPSDSDTLAEKQASAEEVQTKVVAKLQKQLKKHFSAFGKVESVRLRSLGLSSVKVSSGSSYHLVRKVAAAKGSLDDRISSCNAYVVFSGPADLENVLGDESARKFMGNQLRLDKAASEVQERVFDKTRSVFVGNLAFEATEQECLEHVTSCLGEGSVESVRIIRDPVTNLGKGFGYVLLKSSDLVNEALAKVQGTQLRDRELRITRCEKVSKRKADSRQRARNYAGERATNPVQSKTRKEKARAAQEALQQQKTKTKKKKLMASKGTSNKKKSKPKSLV